MADVTAFSGSIPERYENDLGPLLFEPYAIDIIERLKNKNFTSILELACGTGRLTNYISRTFPNAKINATDLNPDMISVGRKKVNANNIQWQPVDMQEIPFKDETFDLTVCQYGLMFVPDKIKAFREIYRTLKKGGIFIFNVWDKIETNSVAMSADKTINTFFPEDPIMFYKTPFSYFDEAEIRKDMKEGGFENISITKVSKEGVSESSVFAARGFIEGNPAVVAINERDPALIPEIKAKLEKELSENFGSKPMRCTLNAIVIEAIK